MDERTEAAVRHLTGQVNRSRRTARALTYVDTAALAAVLEHVKVRATDEDVVQVPRSIADKLHADLVEMDDVGAIELVTWPCAERFVAIVCEQVCR